MHVQISCISRFKIETYLIDKHLTSNTTNSAADSELQPRTAVTSLLLPACGLRDNLSSSVWIASGASLVFLPDSRCWVLTISSRPHCAGPGQNQRPFSRKVASLTPTLPLRPQTFVSSSLSCLVFFFCCFFFSPFRLRGRAGEFTTRAVWLLNLQTWSGMNARWGEAKWRYYSSRRYHTYVYRLCCNSSQTYEWVCVWRRERERERERERDKSALCFTLVEGRDEMCLNRDGDIISWQAAPGRPRCLGQGHALIQS